MSALNSIFDVMNEQVGLPMAPMGQASTTGGSRTDRIRARIMQLKARLSGIRNTATYTYKKLQARLRNAQSSLSTGASQKESKDIPTGLPDIMEWIMDRTYEFSKADGTVMIDCDDKGESYALTGDLYIDEDEENKVFMINVKVVNGKVYATGTVLYPVRKNVMEILGADGEWNEVRMALDQLIEGIVENIENDATRKLRKSFLSRYR